jgi:hypothetical protein
VAATTIKAMSTAVVKKKPAARKNADRSRSVKASAVREIPADLRPLRSGVIKFSAAEIALMDRADTE